MTTKEQIEAKAKELGMIDPYFYSEILAKHVLLSELRCKIDEHRYVCGLCYLANSCDRTRELTAEISELEKL